MADEAPPRRPAGPEPASDAKKHAKRVVLSSVAKSAPASAAESLLGESDASKVSPPELPPKTSDGGLVRPVGWTIRPGGTTTIIKLPPKTGTMPRLTSLANQARAETAPPPPKSPANGEEGARRTAPIRIGVPLSPAPSEQESIFAAPPPSSAPANIPTVTKAPPVSPINVPSVTKALPTAPVEAKAPAAPKRALPPPLPVAKVVEKKTVAPVVTARAEPARVMHVPPLVAHDAPAPEAATDPAPPVSSAPKFDPLAQTARLLPPPPIAPVAAPSVAALPATQGVLPLPEAPGKNIPAGPLPAEARGLDPSLPKHRLPPRSSATGRLRANPPIVVTGPTPAAIPPKVFPTATVPPQVISSNAPVTPTTPAPPAAVARKPVKSSVTPPTIPLKPGRLQPPTIPLRAAPAAFLPVGTLAPRAGGEPAGEKKKEDVPVSRATRKRRQRQVGLVVFYVLFVALLPCLYEAALYFTHETRVEGQVIPPPGMVLGNEVWIVTDFRDLEKGIADDLADDRQIAVQDMQEKLSHVQRAQSDVATREARIRLLKDQIQADNDEQMSLMKQARDASQQIWDGPGAQSEADYQSRLRALNQAIADRAKANRLAYNPDPGFYSPEVWANAYRLALYEVPAGVDAVKERTWLDAQMKAWHDFTKTMDQKQADLRQQAAQLKLQPASKVADLKSQEQDLQGRIDATMAEEEPLKGELDQARNDLAAAQAKEAGLDGKPYEKLDALPEQNITRRLPLQVNGRFSWRELEKENKYAADERTQVFWIFARAFRPDGRQYWALNRFSVNKDSTTLLMIEPDSFISTKAILRPDLSPDEQAR